MYKTDQHMSIALRARIATERRIVKRVVRDALAGGFALIVNDGAEEFPPSQNAKELFDRLMNTDEDYLIFTNPETGTRFGWVRFIYGNDGWDVINDYTVNLEKVLAKTLELTVKLGGA